MAFSLSGSTITQTGTDTDLSGLSGIAGVTVITRGTSPSIVTVYDLHTLKLQINGTLSHDPDRELIVTNAAVPCIRVGGSGVYNFGVERTDNGQTSYSKGIGIHAVTPATNSASGSGLEVQSGGTLNWRGGGIRTAGIVKMFGGAIVEQYAGTLVNSVSNRELQLRVQPSNQAQSDLLNFRDLVFSGEERAFILFSTFGFGTMKPTYERGVFQTYVNAMPNHELSNPLFAANQFGADVYLNANSEAAVALTTVTNPDRFAVVTPAFGNAIKYGIVATFRDVLFRFVDLAGAALQGIKHHAVDADSTNRRAVNGIGFLTDQTYSGTSDVAGQTDAGAVLSRVETLISGESAVLLDNRCTSGSLMVFKFMGYLYGLGQASVETVGSDQNVVDWVMLPDQNISESSLAAVSLYTELETPEKIYDRGKLELYSVFAGETALWLNRVGDQLVMSGERLIVDATAGAVMAYVDGVSITVKAAVYAGSVDGDVLLSNGASMNNGTLSNGDLSVDTAGVTLTNVTIDGPNKLILTAAGSYALDGCEIDEIENTSGGAVTVTLIGGSGVPATLTETSGAIALVNDMVLRFTGMQAGDAVYVEDAAGTQQAYQVLTGATHTVNVPRSADGETWRYSVDRIGYTPQVASFTVAEGTTVEFGIVLREYLKAGGGAMYTTDLSADVAVTFDLVTPQATIDIGDAAIEPQIVFNEFEHALLTAAGMAWHAQQTTVVKHDDLPGVGKILFMEDNIRLRRASGGDVNAALAGYAQSTQGTPIDGTNGDVGFVGGLVVNGSGGPFIE